MQNFTYQCPHCAGSSEVAEDFIGQNVVCPHCSMEFLALPPEPPPSGVAIDAKPGKVPFFKSSRVKLLKAKLDELTADGDYSAEDARVLFYEATRLKLSEADLEEIRSGAVARALNRIKIRIESAGRLTEEDENRIDDLGKAFGYRLILDPRMRMFRDIYRLEAKGVLPEPISITGFSFVPECDEILYHKLSTSWHQFRTRSQRGEKFEEMTCLAKGVLYVSDRRVYFDGDNRNATIALSKITGFDLANDGIGLEKLSGRSDFFTMDRMQGAYLRALILALRKS
jgi:hypothetical protein